MRDDGDVVLITGCSSGIGAATARRLSVAGYQVVATARRREAVAALEAEGCATLALEVTSEDSRQAAVGEVLARFGRIDVLVNNAGYGQSGAVEEVPLAAVRRQFETNVFGALGLIQLVAPGMRARGRGRIVNVSSMGGRLTMPGFGIYHASKYAVEAMSDALRFELRPFGVRVVLIEPGFIRTSFAEAAVHSMAASAPGAATAQAPGRAHGPYDSFNGALARLTVEGYEKGPMAALAGSADDVARVVERALSVRRPRARYTVTASATVMLALRRWLPDRQWDALMRTIVPQPAPVQHNVAERGLSDGR